MNRIINKLLLCAILYAAVCVPSWAQSSGRYVVALDWTPVLNTPDMKSIFGGYNRRTLAVDQYGAVRALEFIAMPGTVFSVDDEIVIRGQKMYRVRTEDYPYESKSGYFIPAAFVGDASADSSARAKNLLPADVILERMRAWVGLPYVWGGNAPQGVARMAEYFFIRPEDDQRVVDQWMLKGLDCSGLLYAATEGWTPRNTSALVNYGSAVMIEGLSVEQIAALVQPLDLIVWNGHVVIVLDDQHVIESRMGNALDQPGPQGGVRIRPLNERLREIFVQRLPVNDVSACVVENGCFVIRRWYNEHRIDENF